MTFQALIGRTVFSSGVISAFSFVLFGISFRLGEQVQGTYLELWLAIILALVATTAILQARQDLSKAPSFLMISPLIGASMGGLIGLSTYDLSGRLNLVDYPTTNMIPFDFCLSLALLAMVSYALPYLGVGLYLAIKKSR